LEFQELPLNRLQYLQFADLKPGILKSYLELGGYIMIKFLSQPQQDNFYLPVLLWFEEKEILFSLIEWKWVLLSYLKLINNQLKDIRTIEKFINKKIKSNKRWCSKQRNTKNLLNKLNNLLSSALIMLQNKK
jgi:hypothetical protein